MENLLPLYSCQFVHCIFLFYKEIKFLLLKSKLISKHVIIHLSGIGFTFVLCYLQLKNPLAFNQAFFAFQVGFVNTLAFAKSAEFLIAGVGQVKFYSCYALLVIPYSIFVLTLNEIYI